MFYKLICFQLLLLLPVHSELRKRHHRRSISYDDRWFGFRFESEPTSSTFRSKSTLLPCTFSLARHRETSVEWRRDSSPISTSDKRFTLHSNGSLSLNDATQSDEGIYQCIVHISDNEGSTWTFLSNKALMRSQGPLKWKVEPKDLSIALGKKGTLGCELDATEGIELKWMKDGRKIKDRKGGSAREEEGIVVIEGMKKEDEGEYWCEGKRGEEVVNSRKARVQIRKADSSVELHLLSIPSSRRVKEGEEMRLDCIPDGEGDVVVEWMKDGGKIGGGAKRIGSSLFFARVGVDDAGTYTCKVNDATDSIETTAVVTVIAPPHITSPPRDTVAMETTDVELECFSSGRPSPTLSWFKNGEMIVPSEYFIIDSNKLRILGLVKTDQGIYECFVENEAGTAHAAAQLLVDNTDSSTIAAHSGSRVKVSAPLGLAVTSIRSREASLTWDAPIHRYGSILHYHVYYREEGKERERVMNTTERVGRITDLHPSTTYQVRVAAENEAGIGDVSSPILLTTKEEQEVPGRISNLRAVGVGSETIEVEWTRPSSEGATPLFYRLFYVRSEKKDEEKETQITVPSTAYTMHGMDKYTLYDIRVEAEGEKGPGLSSDTVSVRTLSDLPSSAPIDITARPLSTTSVRVGWRVEENSVNGVVTGARMKVKTKSRGSKASNIVIDGERREETVEGLEAGTAYQLRIALVNENGTGPYSDWISVETPLREKDESVVLGAPRDLAASATTDSISLRWRPPADESVLVRGYQIGWGLNVPDVESTKVDGDVHEFKISGLRPARDYVISVRAWNRQGSGFPIYETVRTMSVGGGASSGLAEREGELTALESPMGVDASPLSPTSIQLVWADNPSLFNPVYNVKYMSRVDSGQTRYVNTSETRVIVDKLKPGTEYEMAVRVLIPPAGISPWSMTVSQLTLPAPPSSSPRDLTILPAASGDPHAVTVNWQPPKYANGEMLEYIVYYTDRASAREEEWTSIRVPADRLSLPIDNLLPKATYYFRIQAKNVKGVGPMSPNQSYSPGSAGFVIPQGNSVKSKKGTLEDLLAQVNDMTLVAAVLVVLGVLLILILCLLCVCLVKKVFTKKSGPGVGGGRKSSNGMNRNNDLWIQHGVGGASSHLLTETPSINEMKSRGQSPPPRFHGGTMHRGEDPYSSLLPLRAPSHSTRSSHPLDSAPSESSRPLLAADRRLPSHHKQSTHMMMVQVASPAPGSSTGESERSGTLSRSYQHSSTSLDQRQRTPQMMYGAHPRGMGKMDLGESPYGSSLGLGSGTPPPPNVPPPHPPIVTADGYRSIRGPSASNNMSSGALRSFSNMNGMRQIPIGRATAQPRVNVANLCSPYLSSGMEEGDKLDCSKDEERSDPSHLTLERTISVDEMNDGEENIDHMISDLQALQQQFGVKS